MRCEEAAEFVSALCDGERIPREAAEHIGGCEKCRTRLHDYTTMGAELRCAASLACVETVKAAEWPKGKKGRANWWKKGAEAMKIPRFVFVVMLLVIVGLSSGLVVVRARSNAQGPVLLVTLKLPNGDSRFRCALLTDGNARGESCAGFLGGAGSLKFGIRFVQKDGERFRLGLRTEFSRAVMPGTVTMSLDDLKKLPEKQYELEPGEKLEIEIDGLGRAEMTGELLDHMPVLYGSQEALDPAQDELRIVSPLLLRGKEVVFDMEGGRVLGIGKDGALSIYTPSTGRFILSLVAFEGAVQGQVRQSRVDFELNGQRYHLLSGAPITRAEDVWVQLDPDFKPSTFAPGARDDIASIAWAKLTYLLGKER
jgi:hypothetical protein